MEGKLSGRQRGGVKRQGMKSRRSQGAEYGCAAGIWPEVALMSYFPG